MIKILHGAYETRTIQSFIGLLLFLIYINDLPDNLASTKKPKNRIILTYF